MRYASLGDSVLCHACQKYFTIGNLRIVANGPKISRCDGSREYWQQKDYCCPEGHVVVYDAGDGSLVVANSISQSAQAT